MIRLPTVSLFSDSVTLIGQQKCHLDQCHRSSIISLTQNGRRDGIFPKKFPLVFCFINLSEAIIYSYLLILRTMVFSKDGCRLAYRAYVLWVGPAWAVVRDSSQELLAPQLERTFPPAPAADRLA